MTAPGAVAYATTSREEAWKYTPIDEITSRTERAVTATGEFDAAVTPSILDALAGSPRGPRLVFVNGFYDAELSEQHGLASGVWCGLADPGHQPAALVDLDADRSTEGGDVAVVIADAGARMVEPLHIVHVAAPGDGAAQSGVVAHPRTVIEAGPSSRLIIVETYCGVEGPTVTDTSTRIHLAEGADLEHCRIQVESPAATHVGHTAIEQGAASRLYMTSITIGADIARNEIDVLLAGPDAHTELTGLNMTAGHQRHDTVVSVDHAASHGASNQRFAGVVDDHGRGSFSGEIIVRPGTVATDAHQSNRNLVLDPNAEADTRPWLRILADDVRCTHGATVGRLDDDALFYLRSRGIAEPVARTMLVDAFIRDITDAIPTPTVREHVAALVTKEHP